MALEAEWPHPDIGAHAIAQHGKMLPHCAAYAATRVRTSFSYQFYGMVDEVTVFLKDKCADKVPCGPADIFELTVYNE
jgi:hypothetical protein